MTKITLKSMCCRSKCLKLWFAMKNFSHGKMSEKITLNVSYFFQFWLSVILIYVIEFIFMKKFLSIEKQIWEIIGRQLMIITFFTRFRRYYLWLYFGRHFIGYFSYWVCHIHLTILIPVIGQLMRPTCSMVSILKKSKGWVMIFSNFHFHSNLLLTLKIH